MGASRFTDLFVGHLIGGDYMNLVRCGKLYGGLIRVLCEKGGIHRR